MDRSDQQGSAPITLASRSFPRSYVVVLIAMMLAGTAITAMILRSEYEALLEQTEETLVRVADSNERLFLAWIDERRADARTIASFPVTIAAVTPNRKNDAAADRHLTDVLDDIRRDNDYLEILVLNKVGNVVASSTGAGTPAPEIMEAARNTGSEGGVLTIPRSGEPPRFARTAVFFPIMSHGRKAGTAVVESRSAAMQAIFMVDATAGMSGETLLVANAGGKILFVSPVRRAPNGDSDPAPGTAERLALQGVRKFAEFTDQRRRRVFAVTRQVPLVGWGMVTKIDRSEVMKEFREVAMPAGTILLISLGLLVSLAYAIWRHDQVNFLREDLERQRKNEEALRQSEERFVRAFRSSPVGMTITDLKSGKYVEINDAFVRIIGYEREEMIGKSAAEAGILADGAVRDSLVKRLERGELIREESIELYDKTGKPITIELSAEVIQIEGTKRLLSIVRDVTEQRKLETRLRQAQKMEAVGRLAGGIAHDFNNLLAVILGYGEILLEKRATDDPDRGKLQMIYDAGERAAGLTRQLLAFSRQSVMQMRIVNINDVLGETEKMLRRLIGEDIEVVFRAGAKPGTVMADPGQIVQLLMNLSVNARDAMPDGGTLTIETGNADSPNPSMTTVLPPCGGPYVTISVMDSGGGMDAATQAQIFEPFFTTKAMGKGTGLGLATVYGVVEQSHGCIQVRSAVGHGTTFVIYLPVAMQSEEAPEDERQDCGNGAGKENVLLVEDEMMLRKLTAETLRQAGYAVLEAEDSLDAIRLANECPGRIDLLLTDVVMPKLSGPAVAAEVQSTRKGIKVLYMSGHTDNELVQKAISNPSSGFLQKPFARPALLEEIRRILDHPPESAEEENRE